jgi:hypothetical protein
MDAVDGRATKLGPMDNFIKGSSRSKNIIHFIKGKISLSPMETILSITRELEYLESLVKLARKKHNESIKFANVIGVEGTLAIRRMCINKNHRNKILHLLIKINNNLVEGPMDTCVSMSIMVVSVVQELRIMHLVTRIKSYKIALGVVTQTLGRIIEMLVRVRKI